MGATPGTRWVTSVPAARFEALVCLVRAIVLLFGAAALGLDGGPGDPQVGGAVVFHLLLGAASALVVLPLARSRSDAGVRLFAGLSTAADVLLYAGYSATHTGEPGLSSLYGVLVLLLGPLRWGLPGVLATGLPVALVAVVWPLSDATGSAPGPAAVATLALLLCLPAAGASVFWRRSGARLAQAQLLFQAAFEHASIGMALLDARLVVQRSNHALSGLLGVPVDRLAGSCFADWVDPEDRERATSALAGLPSSPHAVRLEVRLVRPDGEPRWGLLAASWLAGAHGVPPRLVVQVENVTDRKTAEQQLAHQALHDELTGLPNRSALGVRLDHALRQGALPCLVFLDLDRLKVVNDGLGHAAGDRLLVEVAQRLQSAVRPGDVVARLGGDEFVVLAGRVDDAEQATALGERVLASLRAPVRLDRQTEVVVSASAGVALADAGSTPDGLLRDADTAMYRAKAAGGGQVVVFTDDLHHQTRRSTQLEAELRQALDGGHLDLAFQPVVHLSTGRVVEAEALLRWRHPERGEVAPEEFVPLAEQSGLIEEIGRWVLARAAADAAGWPALPGEQAPCVGVNVSLRQLQDDDFPAQVRRVLAATGLAPDRLCLEVDETTLAAGAQALTPVLAELHAVGVRLAIDDFGSGSASLAALARLPVHAVKIDGSYVAAVGDGSAGTAVVGGVVAAARARSLAVVAEGVETQAQLDALHQLGVDLAQGFLLARPMSNDALTALLAGVSVPAPRVPALPDH